VYLKGNAAISEDFGVPNVYLTCTERAIQLSAKTSADRETQFVNLLAAVVSYMYTSAWIFPGRNSEKSPFQCFDSKLY
jgi:hypothetical protein